MKEEQKAARKAVEKAERKEAWKAEPKAEREETRKAKQKAERKKVQKAARNEAKKAEKEIAQRCSALSYAAQEMTRAGKRSDMDLEYEIIRSRRKTMSLQVTRDGRVVVRCPLRVSDRKAAEFVREHRDWVLSHLRETRERMEDVPVFTEKEMREYRERARRILTAKTAVWAEKMGVAYGRIAIRQQATRWGSCSTKGNLNFNWVLILLPEELQDYVVVHELAHRKEMNHSSRFWSLVEEQLPDYKARRSRLKEYAGYTNIEKAPDDWVG